MALIENILRYYNFNKLKITGTRPFYNDFYYNTKLPLYIILSLHQSQQIENLHTTTFFWLFCS